MLAALAIPVAACDSASDGAVVTSQAVAGVADSASETPTVSDVAEPTHRGDRAGRNRSGSETSVTGVGQDATAALLLLREEEKLARDVYLEMGELWGLPVFENIAASEQKHMDAVLGLLDASSIADPIGDNGRGVFTDSALQNLYNDLVGRGAASPEYALLVGAMIEDLDIRDLRLASGLSSDPLVGRVLGNLERASLNHLRAFSRQLGKRGVAYTPSHMEAAEYEAVIAAGNERGRGQRDI